MGAKLNPVSTRTGQPIARSATALALCLFLSGAAIAADAGKEPVSAPSPEQSKTAVQARTLMAPTAGSSWTDAAGSPEVLRGRDDARLVYRDCYFLR